VNGLKDHRSGEDCMHSFRSITAWRVGMALGALAIGLSASPAWSQSGTWIMKAPMPAGVRGEVAAVVYQNKLYAIGGNVASNAVPRNEVYDPATDSWRVLAPTPVARDHLGLALVNGRIYTFGGFVKTVHDGAGTDVFEYDPAADTWRSRAPLKSPLGSVGAAVVDNKIHVFGGRGLDKVTTTTHAVYDPATDKWTDAAPLSKGRDHMGVVAAEGKIHVIGGRFANPVDRTDMHEVYDPATNTWSTAAPLKTPRSAVAAALYRGMIVVDGGEWPPEKRTFTENEGYDLKTGSWVSLAPMPLGSHGFGAGAIGPNLYFVGGATLPGGGGLTDRLLMFTLP
jgi:N-acetylneuraminic acid mutarotase